MAKLHLLKNHSAVKIGITGSEGKSSTVDAIYKILSQKYKVKVSKKGNSQTGLPLELLDIEIVGQDRSDFGRYFLKAIYQLLFTWKSYDFYVLEMGIDGPSYPNDMDTLLSIVKPDYAVLTSISSVHGQNYHTSDEDVNEDEICQRIFNEKVKISKYIDGHGFLLTNFDNKYIVENLVSQPDVRFISRKVNKDLKIEAIENQNSGFEVEYLLDEEKLAFQVPSNFSSDFAYSFGYGVYLGHYFGLTKEQIENGLKRVESRASRFNIFKSNIVDDVLIVDSSYNASIRSMEALIDETVSLHESRGGELYLALGEVRELGNVAKEVHEALASKLLDIECEIYLVGKDMKKYLIPVLDSHNRNYFYSKYSTEVGEELKSKISPGDTVLFKGSQNTIYMEEGLKKVIAEDDYTKVCRQSDWWLKRKAEFFKGE